MGESHKTASWNKVESVVEKVWKGIGGNQEDVLQLSMEKFTGHKAEDVK